MTMTPHSCLWTSGLRPLRRNLPTSLLRVRLAAEIGERRVDPEDVRLVRLEQRRDDLRAKVVRRCALSSCATSTRSLASRRSRSVKFEPGHDALAHLGEVAKIVLAWMMSERSGRAGTMPKQVAAHRPAERGLQAEASICRCPSARPRSIAAAPAQVAEAEQFVRVVVRRRRLELADRRTTAAAARAASRPGCARLCFADGGDGTSGMAALSAHGVLFMADWQG